MPVPQRDGLPDRAELSRPVEGSHPAGWMPGWAGRALLALSLMTLLVVGCSGVSAATPPLGPRGWAPGALLPWTLSPATVTALLAGAYVVGGLAVALQLRAPRRLPAPALATLALGCLLVMPFGSADHTNYAAYGQIALEGGDPWTVAPNAWQGGADPVTSGVQPPWQSTPSIYGPLAKLAQLAAAWVGADNLRQVVWVWQVFVVLAWLATRWLLRRLLSQRHALIDVLWTANPLVIATGVLGAHVDTLATPLMVAALLVAKRAGWPGALAAGVLAGLATGVKLTAGVVLLALLLAPLLTRESGIGEWVKRAAALVIGAAAVLVPLQVWAGPHSYEQLGRSRRSISLATPWRWAYEWFGGHLPDATWRSLLFAAAALTCVALAWAVWRLLTPRARGAAGSPRDQAALRLTFALCLAYPVGAPYVLPWYDQLAWALLPAVLAGSGRLPSLVSAAWLVRGVILALAYVPGRVVGLTPAVESFTLGWRTDVAPVGALLVWAAVAASRRHTSAIGAAVGTN